MRIARSLVPLALLVAPVLASPAAAADWRVDAVDFEFQPGEVRIAVGDSVTWSFAVEGHTSASVDGQSERWTSAETGTNAAGSTFTHTFTRPGRYQYVCTPHQTFMKGVVEVGADTVAKSVTRLRARRIRNRVKISFRLREPARVTYRLRGPSRRTLARRRLTAGRHSFTLRGLKKGSYRGVLTATDDFDKKTAPRNSFVIR